jgi:molybdopterin-binding protein
MRRRFEVWLRICGTTVVIVTVYRFVDAARVLAVSDDTIRRWADARRFDVERTADGKAGIEGTQLARLARELAEIPDDGAQVSSHRVSARNQLEGIVTDVRRDTVMAQVELCCGRYRVVSLMSREAADALRLEPGVIAVASIKATNVVIELAADNEHA